MSKYVPERGDIIWLTFDPQSGHEQKGRRPALVISPAAYNTKTGLALVCPITTHEKCYPFEVKLTDEKDIAGVILADQIKNAAWMIREAKFICKASGKTLAETIAKIEPLIKGY